MVFMKKFVFILFLILLVPSKTYGIGIDVDKYFDYGGIYSGSKYPQSVANNAENIELQVDMSRLKRGTASSRNFFGLVEVGDSSINKAAKEANITKIYYVDTSLNKVYIPYFIIPVYAKQKTTIVYGE
jgi:hypothetical protein